jgi:hypothetical protein
MLSSLKVVGIHTITWGGALFPVVKRPGREADHSPQSNAEMHDFYACTWHLNPYILESIGSYLQQQQQQR